MCEPNALVSTPGNQKPLVERLGERPDAIAADEHVKLIADYTGLSRADLQKAGERLREALDAMETQYFAYQGRVGDTRELVNWKTRLAAIRELIKLFGLQTSVSSNRRGGKRISVEVEIHPALTHQ